MSGEFRMEGSDIVIADDSGVKIEIVEAVIDLDESGSPIGIELLSIFDRFPGLAQNLATRQVDGARFAVDEEADALYIRLAERRSVEQLVTTAALAIGLGGTLLGLRVRLER